MMATRTESQTVDFLGFLRGQLQGLQGIPTLCYELIQNADDVKDEKGNPGTSYIVFDICDDALWVENDGVFRPIDFERMKKISWGNKSQEADTTGAFGIGFISVYQITDSPEIFSSGEHWVFRPEEDEQNRILVEEMPTKRTRFRLPWAFEETPVRQALEVPSVDRNALERFTEEIAGAIEHAALFLRQLTTLEVRRNGTLRRKIEVVRDATQTLISNGEKTIEWRIFRGDFGASEDCQALCRKFGGLLENRKTRVEIAIPESPLESGLLYAFLPSESRTGLPFHINADFFPSPDRKRILLGADYKSDWNRLALKCASETLSRRISGLLELYSDLRLFWQFASQIHEADERGPLCGQIPAFWKKMRIGVVIHPTVLTVGEKKMCPRQVFYPRRENEVKAASIFEDLGLPIVHEDLREFQNLLTSSEIGVNILRLSDVLDALERAGFDAPRELAACPPVLQRRENWPLLWEALQSLDVDSDARQQLQRLAIAFGEDGRLYPPLALLVENEAKVRNLFSAVAPDEVMWADHQMSRTSLPGNLVPVFDLERGLDLLEEHADELPVILQNPKHLATLYAWLASQETQLRRSPRSIARIKALPIGPVACGVFKPLSELYLTGNFDDPLQLTDILETSRIAGRVDFVREVLEVRVLDLGRYVTEQVPRAWEQPDLDLEKRKQLVRFLSQHFSQLKRAHNLKDALSQVSLVLCEDGRFRPAREVYFGSAAIRAAMGARAAFVDEIFSQDETIHDFYAWLGVSDELRPADLLAFVRETVQRPPDKTGVQKVISIFRYLAERWARLDEETKAQFTPLKHLPWLPGSRDTSRWFSPGEVYADFQRYLFESQGNFLGVDTTIQRENRKFIGFLGIKDTPELQLVIRHLLFCAQHNEPVNKAVYITLNNAIPDEAISRLKDTACLYIKSETEKARYYYPHQVFFSQHPFGAYRLQLPDDFYQYKKFLDAVGVKERPDHHDAIAVLKEIGQSRLAQSHLSVTGKDEEKVLFAAWAMLNDALLAREIAAEEIAQALSKCKCIPNQQGLLYEPERLFFEDRPGWAEKFSLVKRHIVPRKDGVWQAMQAAGVRPLSGVVETSIADLESPRDDALNIAELLSNRGILLRRVLNNSGQSEAFDARVGAITFFQASKIIINRTLNVFNRQQSIPEEVDAIYLPDDGELYYSLRDGNTPWTSIARELSYALTGGDDVSVLPLVLEKILSGRSLDTVSRDLDNMGYPPLEDISIGKAETVMAHALGDGEEVLGTPSNQWEALSDASPNPPQAVPSISSSTSTFMPAAQEMDHFHVKADEKNTAHWDASGVRDGGSQYAATSPTHWEASDSAHGNDPKTTQKTLARREISRKSSRLISYVLPAQDTDETERPAQESRTQEIGQRGIDLVMEFERRHGRQPENMNVAHPNHPGYDIKSYTPETGQIRYIEVKALTQPWDGRNPARMTHTEFEMAVEKGERYWLYIVEKVESEAPKLYCIQNPARQVQYFCYDHGWMEISTHQEEITLPEMR